MVQDGSQADFFYEQKAVVKKVTQYFVYVQVSPRPLPPLFMLTPTISDPGQRRTCCSH